MKTTFARVSLAGSLLLITAADAFAQSTGGTLQPVQSTLQQLVSTLTGPIATALATLAVIACGLFAWSGRLTWGIAGERHLRHRPGVRLGADRTVFFNRRSGNDGGRARRSPHHTLVKALTRAPTLMGVPTCISCSTASFRASASWSRTIFSCCWSRSRCTCSATSLTLRDDRIFEILFVKSTKCPPRSRTFWAADSYSV